MTTKLWLDFETSGPCVDLYAITKSPSINYQGEVLEVAVALTASEDYEILYSDAWIIPNPDIAMRAINPEVISMHLNNGLWHEVVGADETGVTLEKVDTWIVNAVKQYSPTDKVMLSGSGVSHFDNIRILSHLPKLNSFLVRYPNEKLPRTYDVGIIRRFMNEVGIEYEDNVCEHEHRALSDVHQFIREDAYYKRIIRNLM